MVVQEWRRVQVVQQAEQGLPQGEGGSAGMGTRNAVGVQQAAQGLA